MSKPTRSIQAEPAMDDICGACGLEWAIHMGAVCPKGTSHFEFAEVSDLRSELAAALAAKEAAERERDEVKAVALQMAEVAAREYRLQRDEARATASALKAEVDDYAKAVEIMNEEALVTERAASALRERVGELEAQRASAPADILQSYRDIQPGDECPRCGGWGVRSYGSTATWRGGIGGQAMTRDVCDKCWGSGAARPWPSHRSLLAAAPPHEET